MLSPSSLIRKLLTKSKLNLAKKYLKRNWSIESSVQRGRQMGKKIGFPKCNLDINNYVTPNLGVYAVRIHRRQKNNKTTET